MSVRTPWTFLTESLVIVIAQRKLRILLDMNIKTLVAILTVAVLVVELTFAHLSEVVFVKVVTCIALFTEPLEPMFADIVVIVATVVVLRLLGWCRVSVGATSTSGTLAGSSEVRANRDCRGKGSEAIGTKERSEAEVVSGLWRRTDCGWRTVNEARSTFYSHGGHSGGYQYRYHSDCSAPNKEVA